jgi:hypothetical protein
MTSTHSRIVQALAFTAVLASLAVPATAFGGTGAAPSDWFERYANAHPYGHGDSSPRARDLRSPDTLDAAAASNGSAGSAARNDRAHFPFGGTSDEAQAAQPIDLTTARGFDWSDAGMGAGFATGLLVALGSMIVVLHRRSTRQRIQVR